MLDRKSDCEKILVLWRLKYVCKSINEDYGCVLNGLIEKCEKIQMQIYKNSACEETYEFWSAKLLLIT